MIPDPTDLLSQCHVPGVAMAVVHADHVELGAWGVADGVHPVSATETRFSFASVSKPVTALAALVEVERGALALELDVNRWLDPDLRLPDAFDRPVTLSDLLTHSGGLDDTLLGCGVPASLHDHLVDHPPTRFAPPGRVFAYSNHGFSLVGRAVERSSGVGWAQFVGDRVLRPLGMDHTTVGWPADGALAVAVDADGQPLPHVADADTPAGGLVGTAADLARFAQLVLRRGELDGVELVPPDTAQDWLRPRFRFADGVPGAALGWFERRGGGVMHEGAMGGFGALLTVVPGRDLAVVVLANATPDDCDLPGELTARVLGEPDPTPPVAAPSDAPLPPAGAYRPIAYARSTFEGVAALVVGDLPITREGDTLAIRGTRWVRTGPTTFAHPDRGLQIAARRDPELGWLVSDGLRTWVRARDPVVAHLGCLAVALVVQGLVVLATPWTLRRGWGWRLASALALADLGFVAGFLAPFVAAGGPEWIPFGPPTGWGLVQAIPDLTAAGVVVVGLLAARSPRWFDRVALAAAALAGAAVWGEVTWWSLDR